MPKMYSSEDLEKFHFDSQTEWMPRGISIQAYCSRNNVPYKVLDKWIRDIYKRVVPIQVNGTPEELKIESPQLHVVEPSKKPVWKYYPKDGHPEQVMRFDGTKATPEFMQTLAYEVYMKNVTFGNLHKWSRKWV